MTQIMNTVLPLFGELFFGGNCGNQGISHVPQKQILDIRILLNDPFVGF
jgi:hypothetical protein